MSDEETQEKLKVAYMRIGVLEVWSDLKLAELRDRIKELEAENRRLFDELTDEKIKCKQILADRDEACEEVNALTKKLERHTRKNQEADDE